MRFRSALAKVDAPDAVALAAGAARPKAGHFVASPVLPGPAAQDASGEGAGARQSAGALVASHQPSVSQPPAAFHGGRVTVLDRMMASGPARRFFTNRAVARVLAPARGMGSLAKFLRYSMVSVVAIVISQCVILVAAWLFHLSGIASNALGAAASTPASYELNRKWAWGKRGKSHLWREVVPFWVLTLVGLAASSGTVQIADSMAKSHHVYGLDRAFAIMGASLFAYGVVWVAKFIIFNQVVFRSTEGVAAPR